MHETFLFQDVWDKFGDRRVVYTSGPQPFWQQGPVSRKTIFPGTGVGVGMVQAVMRAMGNDGEREVKLHSLTRCSPPAMRPGSWQAMNQNWSMGWGLRTPGLHYSKKVVVCICVCMYVQGWTSLYVNYFAAQKWRVQIFKGLIYRKYLSKTCKITW